jgi:hypothetical protein
MPPQNDSSSSANTVLITLVLLILVGFVVWWIATRDVGVPTPVQEASDLNIDVDLPGGDAPAPEGAPAQ